MGFPTELELALADAEDLREQLAVANGLIAELDLEAKRLCHNQAAAIATPRDVVADGQPGDWIRAVLSLVGDSLGTAEGGT